MLEFCEVSKIFKTDLLKEDFQALKDVSFKVESGKIVGFLGANGAGKTTSLKIAMDFIRPTSGEVKYYGALGKNKKDAFKKIGFLPERPFFYPHLTGREFCWYMGELAEVSRNDIKLQIQKWAPRFKIDFALDREIKTYSKGMLQRVGFLATLLHSPELIILDEPLSGLDPIGRKELKDIIQELNSEGKSIFFSSHIVSDVEQVCDSVIFLKKGEMLYQGSVDQLISDNIKPISKIVYTEGDKRIEKKVEENDKYSTLEALIQSKANIISVEPERPSLEQIFYNVK